MLLDETNLRHGGRKLTAHTQKLPFSVKYGTKFMSKVLGGEGWEADTHPHRQYVMINTRNAFFSFN